MRPAADYLLCHLISLGQGLFFPVVVVPTGGEESLCCWCVDSDEQNWKLDLETSDSLGERFQTILKYVLELIWLYMNKSVSPVEKYVHIVHAMQQNFFKSFTREDVCSDFSYKLQFNNNKMNPPVNQSGPSCVGFTFNACFVGIHRLAQSLTRSI